MNRQASSRPCPDACWQKPDRWIRVPSKRRPGETEIRCEKCGKFIGYERK